MTIASLGYIIFEVKDTRAWSEFATGVLGLMQVEATELGSRFRADDRSWRIAVEQGKADDIRVAGFEVPNLDALKILRQQLDANGVSTIEADQDMLKSRGVLGLFSCTDPDGLTIEIYYGPDESGEKPFTSPAGVRRFVTGDQGIGHIVLSAPDIAKTRAFYADLLGFRLSDVISMKISPKFSLDLEFYHCNPRHHTLALVPAPAPKRLHHFMVQSDTLDDVGFALDRAIRAGAKITQTLGKHSNDQMVSFYARTPAGFEVEFGWGAREVDETWGVVRHTKTSIWGHKRPT
tara:strand:+ start:174 stop:1046 length:873 start_codon:yes stop_codon:yes gene_type:complete